MDVEERSREGYLCAGADKQRFPTFGLIVCACDLQQAEDTGHAPQTSIAVRVLQAGHRALQQVQHSLIHFPAELLHRERKALVSGVLARLGEEWIYNRGDFKDCGAVRSSELYF